MRLIATLSAVCALGIAGQATAAPAQGSFLIFGPGGLSCGAWTEARREDGFESRANSAWLLGYLTAYNEYVAVGGNIAPGGDVSGFTSWIDNYCQAHPLDSLALAARSLVDELKARKP